MSDTTAGILMNPDVIAVDQDWGGSQGYKLLDDGDGEVWAKPMSDGGMAVVLLNRGETSDVIGVTRQQLRLPRGSWRARELWTHLDQPLGDALSATVPAHGAMMYTLSAER
jgi:alpha-galactosidase